MIKYCGDIFEEKRAIYKNFYNILQASSGKTVLNL